MSNRSITLVAPARFVEDAILAQAVDLCAAHGLEARISESCRLRHHQFAGSDAERAEAFLREWNEGEGTILWCVRGGYGSGRLLSSLRGRLEATGKMLVGYSDQTYLLAHVAKNGLGVAVHAPMPVDLEGKRPAVETLIRRIASGFDGVTDFTAQSLRGGGAMGPAIAGNLSILTRLIGTSDEPDWTGAILIVEDVDEPLYAIDRMFLHLREAGILNRIAGLGLGGFTGLRDNEIPFGATVADIALYHTQDRPIPVVGGLPVGHGPGNVPVILGARAELLADAGTLRIVQ